MVSRFSVLARNALWNPRLVVRMSALTDFSGVLPVVFASVVTAAWACRCPGFWCCWVWTNAGTTRLGLRHLAGVDWVRLNARAELETQTHIVVFVRHCVLRVEIARIDKVNGSLVVERCEVLATIVVVILHGFLPFINHVFYS